MQFTLFSRVFISMLLVELDSAITDCSASVDINVKIFNYGKDNLEKSHMLKLYRNNVKYGK